MIGFGMASSGGTHLRPRFADHWLPADWEPVLVRLQEAMMALFCLGFAVVAFQVLAQTYAIHERSVVLQVAVWPFQAVIPVVFVIAAVRHGLYAAQPQLRPVERGGGRS
jgi:TRAP-type C4-dicarboxylate transport system permease small subunit